mmetsp:Transcript_52144/g.124226  ORF Transcript_52144/g.124226 Transcript_52144/m.124226 type:complete len:272 (+) Transcript_52144:117-932(+)
MVKGAQPRGISSSTRALAAALALACTAVSRIERLASTQVAWLLPFENAWSRQAPAPADRDSLVQRSWRVEGSTSNEPFCLHHHLDLVPWRAVCSLAACLAVSVALLGSGASVGAADPSSGKILAGGASTGDRGSRKNMTRGVVMNEANFAGKNMKGVSFQQSSIQFGNFRDANLENASFFDADIKSADFTNAQMNQVNLELARVEDAILDNAVLTEAYISSNTNMKVRSIDGADFTDALLGKDQVKYLCGIAKGTNTFTKVDTADSLGCPS